MKLALLTCTNLPEWEEDDRYFHAALDSFGIDWSLIAWDSDTDWSVFDFVLIRTTWDYVERRVEFKQRLKNIALQTVLINSYDVIEWNLEKTYLKDLLEAGLPVAPTVWIDESIDVKMIMQENGWTHGFFKPVVGACALNTMRFTLEDANKAQAWLEGLIGLGERMMFQPYLNTVETEGEYSAIYFGRTLSHCVQKIPVLGDYRVQDDYGASDRSIQPRDYPEMMELAEQTVSYLRRRFPRLLVARLDFLRMTEGEFVINEVELIEPSLFFRHSSRAGRMLAAELLSIEKQRRIGYEYRK